MTRDELITWEERAAIFEYDGGLSRCEAERRATKIVEGRGNEADQLELL
jgi:hypothetical protein